MRALWTVQAANKAIYFGRLERSGTWMALLQNAADLQRCLEAKVTKLCSMRRSTRNSRMVGQDSRQLTKDSSFCVLWLV